MSCVKTRRLFIALWPDPATRNAIESWSSAIELPPGAQRVAPEDWHLTLEFLGVVPEPARPAIEALLSDFPAQSEPLVLDRSAIWHESSVGVLCASRTPAPLADAQRGLREALRRLKCRVDARPFEAHVTVFRSLRLPFIASEPSPVVWRLTRLVLAEANPAVGSPRYTPLLAHDLS